MANPREQAPAISVIMPVRNAMKYLPRSIAGLIRAMEQRQDTELIVIDNGSTDGTREWLARQAVPRLQLLVAPELTVGALRNRGASIARGEYLSFIDADCVVPPDYFHRAMTALNASGADAVGCYYQLPPNPTRLELAWDDLHAPRREGFVHLLNAGNFLIRRPAFERAGGFSASLVTGEDAELGLRLQRLGFSQFETPDMVAVHIGNPTTLRQFFRKELWHGRGMFGTFRLNVLDKPVWMTLAHLLAMISALLIVVTKRFSAASVLGFFLLLLVVPVAAVTYRASGRRRVRYPVLSVLLYFLYFSARVCALPFAIVDAMLLKARRPAPLTAGSTGGVS